MATFVGLGLLGLCCALGFASSAFAAPMTENEPNDNLFQAQPVVSVDGISGLLATLDDQDEYLVTLRPQRQIRLTIALAPGSSTLCRVYAGLDDPTNQSFYGYLARPEADGRETPQQASELLTTPGIYGGASTTLALKVFTTGLGEAGCSYTVSISGATGGQTDAIDPTPPAPFPVLSVAEPNDFPNQALGLINTNSIYEGAIETQSDADYLVVPLKSGTNASVVASAVGGYANVTLLNSKNEQLASKQVDDDQEQRVDFSAPGDEPVYIRMTGGTGARWRLRLLPGAVFLAPPAPRPAAVKAIPNLIRIRGRHLTVRFRLVRAGRLRVVLVGKGRRIEVARLTAKGPRTLTLGYRRPKSMKKGRYRLEATFQVRGRPPGVFRRYVVFR